MSTAPRRNPAGSRTRAAAPLLRLPPHPGGNRQGHGTVACTRGHRRCRRIRVAGPEHRTLDATGDRRTRDRRRRRPRRRCCTGAFVAGLGSAPRGRQTAISFGWARHLGTGRRGDRGVPDCGLTEDSYAVDVTERLLRLSLGWAWNELPQHYLPDLEAAVAQGLPIPTGDDRQRLRVLLDLVRTQPAGTLPSELEKAVARSKIVPGTDKYQRYGILIGLSEIGVLPCPACTELGSVRPRHRTQGGVSQRQERAAIGHPGSPGLLARWPRRSPSRAAASL